MLPSKYVLALDIVFTELNSRYVGNVYEAIFDDLLFLVPK